ncbi:MAG TPA: hypothetical protein VGX48_17865 [Pyrinomonadaceae bacterium]|jgi:ribosomal protein S27AE|nr:hypothetical protein [Pyrinomonadaceae bacterium]
MFCPNCGKGEQAPDSYCRSCGHFLADHSSKSYLLSRLLGGSTPEAQVNFNLILDFLTAFASTLLLGMLKGFYDKEYEKTGELPPRIIYFVYLFLGLVTLWQLMSVVVGGRLRKKMSARRKSVNTLPAGAPQKSLPQADTGELVPPAVTEEPTKILDKEPRE